MSDEKWDKLPYILKTASGDRSLVILSNFQATEGGCFDTGHYTVTENSVTLGDIFVDLYSDRGIRWNGKPAEFTQEQIGEIVDHIIFGNLDDELPF
jgi:hypothetical protein